MFLGAWSTTPDWKEQNQMCSHGSRERGINSTLPHLGSLMVFKRSSDLPKSPPVWIMLQSHSSLWGALCPRTFAFFYCWKVFLRKMYHFMETSLRGKNHCACYLSHHSSFEPFLYKKEVLGQANTAPSWIHWGIWATGLNRAAEEMVRRRDGGKERWREGERATILELSPQAEWEAKIQDSGTAQRVVEKIKLTTSMNANLSSSWCHSVTYRAPQKHRLWLAPLPCSMSNGAEKARQQAFNKSRNSSVEASAISLTWETKLLAKL